MVIQDIPSRFTSHWLWPLGWGVPPCLGPWPDICPSAWTSSRWGKRFGSLGEVGREVVCFVGLVGWHLRICWFCFWLVCFVLLVWHFLGFLLVFFWCFCAGFVGPLFLFFFYGFLVSFEGDQTFCSISRWWSLRAWPLQEQNISNIAGSLSDERENMAVRRHFEKITEAFSEHENHERCWFCFWLFEETIGWCLGLFAGVGLQPLLLRVVVSNGAILRSGPWAIWTSWIWGPAPELCFWGLPVCFSSLLGGYELWRLRFGVEKTWGVCQVDCHICFMLNFKLVVCCAHFHKSFLLAFGLEA